MKILRKLSSLFRRESLDTEMAEEMRLHVELQTAQNIEAGMNADDAHYAAQRQFGNVANVQERARDARGWVWLSQLWQDLDYGLRSLRKNPGFTVVAVLTLGFGIGVNTTIFSVIEDLIARPASRDKAQRLVVVHLARQSSERGFRPFSYPEFEIVRDGGVFSRAAAIQFTTVRIGPKSEPRQRLICLVSEDYFRILGVTPWRGRFFNADESRPNADRPVIVASYALWQRLGSASDFVGSQLEIAGRAFTVIGVAPRGFGGLQWSIGPDLWTPLGVAGFVQQARGNSPANVFDPKWRSWNIVASLGSGSSIENANAGVAPLNERLAGLTADADGRVGLVVARPSADNLDLTSPSQGETLGTYAAMAMGITIAVLLVACLNVANMLLARGAARQREIAIRLSIGASRGRIIRQLVTEGLLLGLAGGVCGLCLSQLTGAAMLDLARRVTSGQWFSFHLQTTVGGSLVAATLGLSLLATLAFSVWPAVRATRLNPADDLKRQSGDAAAAHRSNGFFSAGHALVMLQIALSVMLLFSAGLFLRCTMNIAGDRGFSVDRQLLVQTDYRLHPTPKEDVPRLQQALVEQVSGVPGVERVALASKVPYNFEGGWGKVFAVDTGPSGAHASGGADGIFNAVSNDYFETLGIPLLRGRDFTERESQQAGGPRSAIIDETLAKSLFGGEDPVGRRIALSSRAASTGEPEKAITIVGLIRSPQDDPFAQHNPPRIYLPLGQEPRQAVYIHVRAIRPETVLPALRRSLGAFDAERPVVFCGTLSAIVDNNLNFWSLRMVSALFGVFGGAAVFLAAVGVYGVKAYAVTRRTREIGVRIALGATTRDVLRLILGQGVQQAVVGIAAGVLLSMVVGLGLSKLLYRVAPADPVVLGFAALVAISAAIIAAAIPAWRATRIPPTEALRVE